MAIGSNLGLKSSIVATAPLLLKLQSSAVILQSDHQSGYCLREQSLDHTSGYGDEGINAESISWRGLFQSWMQNQDVF